jgi:hypothetical protein
VKRGLGLEERKYKAEFFFRRKLAISATDAPFSVTSFTRKSPQPKPRRSITTCDPLHAVTAIDSSTTRALLSSISFHIYSLLSQFIPCPASHLAPSSLRCFFPTPSSLRHHKLPVSEPSEAKSHLSALRVLFHCTRSRVNAMRISVIMRAHRAMLPVLSD